MTFSVIKTSIYALVTLVKNYLTQKQAQLLGLLGQTTNVIIPAVASNNTPHAPNAL
jgi:hypothetical protein